MADAEDEGGKPAVEAKTGETIEAAKNEADRNEADKSETEAGASGAGEAAAATSAEKPAGASPRVEEPAVSPPGQGKRSALLSTLLTGLISIGVGALLFIVLQMAVLFWQTRSYVNEIGAAFDLNAHLTDALLLLSFVAVAFFLQWCFSLSRWKRQVGYAGLLVLLVGHSLALWQASRARLEGKCYVVTRTGITYGEHPGLDAATGRPCRPVTDELQERLRAYETGARPTRIVSQNPVFFDPRTGEPIVWYYRTARGEIELFDLMGFHPETGEELQPVTKEVAALWTEVRDARRARSARRPERVDPAQTGYFDPLTGEPKVWFAELATGREFFDGPGFHPVTGERLTVVTPELVESWRAAEAERQSKAAEEVRRREEAARLETERLERQRLALAQQAIEQQRLEVERTARTRQAAADCDRLAANPNDQRRGAAPGVSYEALKPMAREAAAACDAARAAFPDELRYQYQYARAMQFIDRQKAFELQRVNAQHMYPAAFDNLGWLYVVLKNDYAEAARQFGRGVQLGDPDSMVSLAELISTGRYQVEHPVKEVLELYARAAQLGDQRAAEAYAETKAAIEAQVTRAQQEQRLQGQMLDIFGRVLSNIPRR